MASMDRIGYIQKEVVYTDTTSFHIGYLPPNAYIVRISVSVTTDFTDGVLDIGNATTAAAYANDVALNGVGVKTVTPVAATWGTVESTTDQTEIKGIVVATGTGLAAGAAKAIIEFAYND